MTWLYVPCVSATATEASSSDCEPSGSTYEPWLVLSGTATRRPFSWPGWKRRTWIQRLSGTISRPSTAQRGVDEWIWSLRVSPANRSVPQGSVEVSMTSDGSGHTSPGSSLTWDRESCSWRTSPDLFGQVSLTSSPTLPTSGSMRNGRCSQRPPLAPLTAANASGSWPSPMAADALRMSEVMVRGNPTLLGASRMWGTLTDRAVRTWPTPVARETGRTHENEFFSLGPVARMWGTPVARDDQKSPEAHMAMKERMGRNTATSLTVQVKMWPEAAATHGRQSQTTSSDGDAGSPRADLNPRFVAALMGVPWGWLTPSTLEETDWSRWQQAMRSDSSSSDMGCDAA